MNENIYDKLYNAIKDLPLEDLCVELAPWTYDYIQEDNNGRFIEWQSEKFGILSMPVSEINNKFYYIIKSS